MQVKGKHAFPVDGIAVMSEDHASIQGGFMSSRMSLAWRAGLVVVALTGCARNAAVLELHPAVVYEKPRIANISHSVLDRRAAGGAAVVTVVMEADPGLEATFDIYPGVADRVAMKEIETGRYVGEMLIPPDRSGNTYTITGRVRHQKAGESVIRDPEPLIMYLEALD